MKHFKQMALAACAVFAFGFAACSTDDDSSNSNNGNGGGGTTVTYTVTLTGGANATRNGGEATQSGLSGAMTTVTYTANSGYKFSEFNPITSNGITAIRTSESVVTVFGTPTANANIAIPDAAAISYIGTKAPTEAKAVGDIVFNDGSATPYSEDLTLTDTQKATAIAVIFYAGASADVFGEKILGVGLKNTQGETTKTYRWAPGGTTGFTTHFTDIQCTPSATGSGAAGTAAFTGDIDGSDNWSKVCATDTTEAENVATNYPAFNWVNNYANTNSLTGDYAGGWYLPTVAELSMMYRVKATVNAALEKAGGTKIADTAYWSSSQDASHYNGAWLVWFNDGALYDFYKKGFSSGSVCGVRAF